MINDFAEMSVSQGLDGLRRGEFSSQELVLSCLKQIRARDPEIKSFVSIHEEDALEKAKESDQRYRKGSPRDLEGIPLAIKDNFNIKGWLTTASSAILRSYVSPYTATVVRLLEEAGAVVVGKTNMDAFAHGSSTETSDLFTTRNPHDTSRLPGGSSGGSAAAVASGEVLAAIGSETAGSIRHPASWCGVVGLKPTYGLVSRYGLIAMASSTDSPGPLTKTVADAAFILNAIAGPDPYDATCSSGREEDYTSDLGVSIRGLVVGVPREYLDIDLEDGVRYSFNHALSVLKDQGVETKEISLLAPKYSVGVYTILQRSEVSSNLARLDGLRYGNLRSHLGDEAKKRIMLGTYTLSTGYYDAYYEKAQKVRTLIIEDYKKAFSQVDLIVAPTTPSVALPIGASSGQAMFGELADILVEGSSIAGLPGINVPCGYVDHLPVGLQIVGPMFEEKKILRMAAALEEAL